MSLAGLQEDELSHHNKSSRADGDSSVSEDDELVEIQQKLDKAKR